MAIPNPYFEQDFGPGGYWKPGPGWTAKACPGCGSTGKTYGHRRRPEPHRKKDHVCSECVRKLLEYERIKAELAEKDLREEFKIPWAPHSIKFPRRYLSRFHMYRRRSPVDVLQKCFWNLLFALSKPIVHVTELRDSGFPHDPVRRFEPRVWTLVWRLKRVIALVIESAYQEGVKHGHEMLVRLSDGEISVNDFNQFEERHGL